MEDAAPVVVSNVVKVVVALSLEAARDVSTGVEIAAVDVSAATVELDSVDTSEVLSEPVVVSSVVMAVLTDLCVVTTVDNFGVVSWTVEKPADVSAGVVWPVVDSSAVVAEVTTVLCSVVTSLVLTPAVETEAVVENPADVSAPVVDGTVLEPS